MGLGLAITVGLAWLIRVQKFTEYQEWKRFVPPLEPDFALFANCPSHSGEATCAMNRVT